MRALTAVMDDSSTSGDIFNVGSREQISIRALAERVIGLTGSSSQLVYVPYDQVYEIGIEDMLHRIPSTDKIAAAVGWRPTHDLDRTLADVVEHVRTTSALEAAVDG